MNVYVLVEGRKAARKIYKNWIPYINSALTPVNYIGEVTDNNFHVVAGFGQPEIFDRISDAIADVNKIQRFVRLVVAIDSENQTFDEKQKEVEDFIKKAGCRTDYRVVIQHFCIETWLTGNRDVFRKNPTDPTLREFYNVYNIRTEDPENLPAYKEWNRAQFSYEYLRMGMKDRRFEKGSRVSYSKRNPGSVTKQGFFDGIQARFKSGHIESWGSILQAFV